MRKVQFLVIKFLLLGCSMAYSKGWTPKKELYSDQDVTVEIQFKIRENSCAAGGRQNKYRYYLSGNLKSREYYISWKMDYIDCNGNIKFKQSSVNIGKGATADTYDESLDYTFIGDSVLRDFYDVRLSTSSIRGGGIKVFKNSNDPSSISGETNIYRSQTTLLNVSGGRLGIGGDWIWYQDSCGGPEIAHGSPISVDPIITTTYYVRAQGTYNKTQCASVLINVDQHSTDPSAIRGNKNICEGVPTELTVAGGTLGLDANWVWYKNFCGGESFSRGTQVRVTPKDTTTYYVRAEGKLNNTQCAQITVFTYEPSTEAKSLVSKDGHTTICEGEGISLSVKGGVLAPDAIWSWYSGNCGGISVGNGITRLLRPIETTTYYARGEGVCPNTNCVSIEVIVKHKSLPPTSISKPDDPFKRKKNSLNVIGGTLGTDAEWKWYKVKEDKQGVCGTGRSFETGKTIEIRPKKSTIYFVRAETKGPCGETVCAEVKLDPRPKHKFHAFYEATDDKHSIKHSSKNTNKIYNNKFLHLGFGIGADWMRFSSIADYSESLIGNQDSTTKRSLNINGLGLRGEFIFHPLMRQRKRNNDKKKQQPSFSIGLLTGGAIGITTDFISASQQDTAAGTEKENYLYTRLNLGLEVAAGSKNAKLLLIYKNSIQTHDFKRTITIDTRIVRYVLDLQVRKEILSAGIRLGPYSRQLDKKGFAFDFTYSLSRDHAFNWSKLKSSELTGNTLTDWHHGAGFELWIQSVLKIQFEAIFNSELGYISNSKGFEKGYYNVSLIYNRNLFY